LLNTNLVYKTPGRNQVTNELIELNYSLHGWHDLVKEADVFGLSFFGDADTVRKCPLLNNLAYRVYRQAVCFKLLTVHIITIFVVKRFMLNIRSMLATY